MSNQRFIDQARDDYEGTPLRIARFEEPNGEVHVIVEMSSGYFLGWIGAELAPFPDEYDEPPFPGLVWEEVPA